MLMFRFPRACLHALILVAAAAVVSPGASAQSGEDLTALNQQVADLMKARKYAEALPIAERAVRAAEQQHGQDHLDVARPLSNLGFLFDNQGRRGDAEPVYKRALAIGEKKLGPEHLDVAWSLNSLAGVYRAQNRYGEALATLAMAAAPGFVLGALWKK